MDVKGIGGDNLEYDVEVDLRRGPWTVDEDLTLINYIATHGEGRWNSLARSAGLKRTGKSCRLRWLNYLRPDVRRGNISLEEQLLILELHSRWGNRWSKIAQYLPGRTDNEIKNYWRTRVQKHAKQLKCDVNSKQFKDTMRYLWMPRLVERIQAAAAASATAPEDSQTLSTTTTVTANTPYNNNLFNTTSNMEQAEVENGSIILSSTLINNPHHSLTNYTYTPDPDNTSTPASSDSFGTHLSPLSQQFTHHYNYNDHISSTPHHHNYYQPSSHLTTPPSPSFHSSQLIHPTSSFSIQPDDTFDNFWNLDNILFLHQHLNTDAIL